MPKRKSRLAANDRAHNPPVPRRRKRAAASVRGPVSPRKRVGLSPDAADLNAQARSKNLRRGASPHGGPGRAERARAELIAYDYTHGTKPRGVGEIAAKTRQGGVTTEDIQRYLRKAGFRISVDGLWGPETAKAWSEHAGTLYHSAVESAQGRQAYMTERLTRPANPAEEFATLGPEDRNRLKDARARLEMYMEEMARHAVHRRANDYVHNELPAQLQEETVWTDRFGQRHQGSADESHSLGDIAQGVAGAAEAAPGWFRSEVLPREQKLFANLGSGGNDPSGYTNEELADAVLGKSASNLIFHGHPGSASAAGLEIATVFPALRLARALGVGARAAVLGVEGVEGASRVSAARAAARVAYHEPPIMTPVRKQLAKRYLHAGDMTVAIPGAGSHSGRVLESLADSARPGLAKALRVYKTPEERAFEEMGRLGRYEARMDEAVGRALEKVGKKLNDAEQYALRIVAEEVTPEVRIAHHLALADAAPDNQMKLYHGLHATVIKQAEKHVQVTDGVPLLKPSGSKHLHEAWRLLNRTTENREQIYQMMGLLSDESIANRLVAPARVFHGAEWKQNEEALREALDQSQLRKEAFATFEQVLEDPVEQRAAKQLFDANLRSAALSSLGDQAEFDAVLAHLRGVEAALTDENLPHELRTLFQSALEAETPELGNYYIGIAQRLAKHPGKPVTARSAKRIIPMMVRLRERAIEGQAYRYWYTQSAKAIVEHVGGNVPEAIKVAKLLAVYSPRAAVWDGTTWNNVTRALGAYEEFQRSGEVSAKWSISKDTGPSMRDRFAEARGEEARAPKRDWQTEAANKVMHGGTWGGLKTNSFYRNFLEDIAPEQYAREFGPEPAVTIDSWMRRAFDYPVTKAKGGKRAGRKVNENISEEMYGFMSDATRAIATELGWAPKEAQAAIWTSIKAEVEGIPLDAAGVSFKEALAEYRSRGQQMHLLQASWADNAEGLPYKPMSNKDLPPPEDIVKGIEGIRENGGHTWNGDLTNFSGDGGFAVSVKGAEETFTLDKVTPDTVINYRERHEGMFRKHPGLKVGAWHNAEDGQVYLDATLIVDTKEEALSIGAREEQQAIYDIANDDVIDVSKGITLAQEERPPIDTLAVPSERRVEGTRVVEHYGDREHTIEFEDEELAQGYAEQAAKMDKQKDEFSSWLGGLGRERPTRLSQEELDAQNARLRKALGKDPYTLLQEDFYAGGSAEDFISGNIRYLRVAGGGQEGARFMEWHAMVDEVEAAMNDGRYAAAWEMLKVERGRWGPGSNQAIDDTIRTIGDVVGGRVRHLPSEGVADYALEPITESKDKALLDDIQNAMPEDFFQRGGQLSRVSPYGIKGSISFTDPGTMIRLADELSWDSEALAEYRLPGAGASHAWEAVINFSEHADISTVVHELSGHFFPAFLTDTEYGRVAKWAGGNFDPARGMIDREAAEKVARGMEEYLRRGTGPPRMKQVFKTVSVRLGEIYDGTDLPDLTPEIEKVFARMFTAPKLKGGRLVGAEDIGEVGFARIPTMRGRPIPHGIRNAHRAAAAYTKYVLSGGRVIGKGAEDKALRKAYTGAALKSGYFTFETTKPVVQDLILASRVSLVHRLRGQMLKAARDLPTDVSDIAIKVDPDEATPDAVRMILDRMAEVDAQGGKITDAELNKIDPGFMDTMQNDVFPSKIMTVDGEEMDVRSAAAHLLSSENEEPIPNVRWIPREWLDAAGLIPRAPRSMSKGAKISKEAGLMTVDAINDLSKVMVLYLNPSYIPINLFGNLVMNVMQQGVFAGPNLLRSAFMHQGLDIEHRLFIDTLMGNGLTASMSLKSSPGQLVHATLGTWINQAVDLIPRRSAWLHEARRENYKNLGEVRGLIEQAMKGNEEARDTVQMISYRARDAIVDYERMSPIEREITSRLIFFYPWLKGATRYSYRFALEHPAQSVALMVLGEHAYHYQKERLGETPFYEQFDVPISTEAIGVGDHSLADVVGKHEWNAQIAGQQMPMVVDVRQGLTMTTPIDLIEAGLAAVTGRGNWPTLVENLTPALYSAGVMLFGYDPFRHKEVPQDLSTFIGQLQDVPQGQRFKALTRGPGERRLAQEKQINPRTREQEVWRTFFSGLAPTPYNRTVAAERVLSDLPTAKRHQEEAKRDAEKYDIPLSAEALDELHQLDKMDHEIKRGMKSHEKLKIVAKYYKGEHPDWNNDWVDQVDVEGEAQHYYEAIRKLLFPTWHAFDYRVGQRKSKTAAREKVVR